MYVRRQTDIHGIDSGVAENLIEVCSTERAHLLSQRPNLALGSAIDCGYVDARDALVGPGVRLTHGACSQYSNARYGQGAAPHQRSWGAYSATGTRRTP